MRYYLKIGEREFPNVSEMEITEVYRKESIQQNLAGGYLIDRAGNEKVKISAKLNMLSREEMVALRLARRQISNTVVFDRGGVMATAQMILHEFEEPTPVKYQPLNPTPGLENEYVYLTVNITLEEI